MTMRNRPPSVEEVVRILRSHSADLRRRGVLHAAVFGSVARGEARSDSDIDIVIDLDPGRPMGLFEYTRVTLDIGDLFDRPTDVVVRRNLKPALRDSVAEEAVHAF
ncbi:DNA polymerase III subunit beta [Azospirillum argentinense]|uniref:DNA polymerase III subunit beta n=1 Tax=Azospirillum argentinense TaxID=2970906 RepID=A0A060DF45_9PROT|nr:nucleotidyltransferase [Azospirillum argentinense]AIB11417.1 DNA polymerase III subunit beta [Azospirillum argentinense]EZQ08338.1 DNA polymerase III subunit beta [Azospirillum argentinense]PNR00632.1 nucleotidyltransferase [Azospirillum argentinense]